MVDIFTEFEWWMFLPLVLLLMVIGFMAIERDMREELRRFGESLRTREKQPPENPQGERHV